MQNLRNTNFTKFFWGFMSLYILNFSIDTSEAFSNNSSEYLNYNEQESIVEVFVEKIFGFEDAFSENVDFESEQDSKLKKTNTINLFLTIHLDFESQFSENISLFNSEISMNNISKPYFEVFAPPPELFMI